MSSVRMAYFRSWFSLGYGISNYIEDEIGMQFDDLATRINQPGATNKNGL